MADPVFQRTIRLLQQRVDVLIGRSVSEDRRGWPQTVSLQELQTTLEELRVMDEEYRRQQDELGQTQEKLDAERRRYQDLFEFAPDGYLVTTLEGTIREANLAAADLLRLPVDRLRGKPLAVF